MARYKVEVPGLGTYSIESDVDLTDDEVLNQLSTQMATNPGLAPTVLPPEGAPADARNPTTLGQPGFGRVAKRTFRRVKEAAEFAEKIPTSVFEVIGGVPEERAVPPEQRAAFQGRLQAAARLLGGIFSPVLAVGAPVEAAVEEAAVGTGVEEETARTIGDLSLLPITLGVGLLAKAGKLTKMGQLVSDFLTGAKSSQSLAEQVKKDPQLRFAITRKPPAAASELEELARRPDITMSELTAMTRTKLDNSVKQMEQDLISAGVDVAGIPGAVREEVIRRSWERMHPGQILPGMEQVAYDAKATTAAEAVLKNKAAAADSWTEFAKRNNVDVEGPTPGIVEIAENAKALSTRKKDVTLFGTLGTPATRASRLHPAAGDAAMEIQAVEISISNAQSVRAARVTEALQGIDDRTMLEAVRTREARPFVEAITDIKVPMAVKRVLRFINDKFEVDRQILIPRLRKIWRPRIESRIRRQLEKTAERLGVEVDEVALRRRVDDEVRKAVPEDWGIENYLSHIWPGAYKILDKKGLLLDSVNNKMEAKLAINKWAEETGMSAKDFTVSHKSYFDEGLVRFLKGRAQRTAANIARGGMMTDEEIAAAVKGDFGGPRARIKFFGAVLERKGRAKGYTEDLMKIFEIYDRGIERFMQLTDLSESVAPIIADLERTGFVGLSRMLDDNLRHLWGYRTHTSQLLDNTIAATPVLRDIAAPGAAEAVAHRLQNGAVNVFLKFNARYHLLNSTQMAATLWPIASAREIARGFKLWRSAEGRALLKRHQISERLGKVEGFAKGLGAPERMNQQVAFLTMYNKARRLGLNDQQATIYGLMRGNVYSQFLGLVTDKPTAFRRINKNGLLFMFQRFPIKQVEMGIDLIKDRNFPGAAKFLTTNFLLGGFKAATLGTGGWLTFKAYEEIRKEFGRATADLFHLGLPSLLNTDMSGSVMLVNPPFGATPLERVGNLVMGPVLGTTYSTVMAGMGTTGLEQRFSRRIINSLMQRIPILRSAQAMGKLMSGDFDFRDPAGRLRWRGDMRDAIVQLLGGRPVAAANLDAFTDGMADVIQRRNEVLNFAAMRHGQARLAGISVPEEMLREIRKEVNNWNAMWGDIAPIGFDDIMTRAESRHETAVQTLRERLLKRAPAAIRRGGLFTEGTGG